MSCTQEALIDLPHSRKPVSPLPSTCYHITVSSFHQNTESRMASLICSISFLWSSIGQSETVSLSVVSDSLQPHGLQPARLLCPRDSPGKNTGVGCDFLFQSLTVLRTFSSTSSYFSENRYFMISVLLTEKLILRESK